MNHLNFLVSPLPRANLKRFKAGPWPQGRKEHEKRKRRGEMGGGPLLLSSPLVLRFSQHCFFTIMHGTAERIFPLTGGAVLEPYLLHTTGAVKLREHPPKRISRLVMEHSKRCLYRAIASPLLHEWVQGNANFSIFQLFFLFFFFWVRLLVKEFYY